MVNELEANEVLMLFQLSVNQLGLSDSHGESTGPAPKLLLRLLLFTSLRSSQNRQFLFSKMDSLIQRDFAHTRALYIVPDASAIVYNW